MIAANWHLVSVGVGSWTGAGAFVVIAVLAFLLNRERPRAIWAHLALLSFVEFTICGLGLAMGVQNLGGLPLWSALHGGRTDHAGGRRSPAFLVESVRAPDRRGPDRRSWSIHDGSARYWRRSLGRPSS